MTTIPPNVCIASGCNLPNGHVGAHTDISPSTRSVAMTDPAQLVAALGGS